MTTMRVIGQCRITPQPEIVAPLPLPLTFFDIIHLDDPPVEALYFYSFPHPTSHFMSFSFPHLKSSLSLTLHHFYPLAGHLSSSPGTPDQFELRYTSGDSVMFSVSEWDHDFTDLINSHPRSIKKLNNLTPKLINGDLLAIQVTVFPGQGICMGVAVNHVVSDGSSSHHFITSWAATTNSALYKCSSPSYDRTSLTKFSGLYTLHYQLLKSRVHRKFEMKQSSSEDMVSATFYLRPIHIEKLKKKFHSSTFVLACAYVWMCLVKARGYHCRKTSHFLFVADCRQTLVPDKYFGNCIRLCFAEAKVDDLTGDDGFLVASRAIIEAINMFKGKSIEVDAEQWLEKLQCIGSKELLSISGSLKLNQYDTDFGWGRPMKVELPSIKYTGAMSLIKSRDERGAVEIGLVLQRDHIERFGAQFANWILHNSRL